MAVDSEDDDELNELLRTTADPFRVAEGEFQGRPRRDIDGATPGSWRSDTARGAASSRRRRRWRCRLLTAQRPLHTAVSATAASTRLTLAPARALVAGLSSCAVLLACTTAPAFFAYKANSPVIYTQTHHKNYNATRATRALFQNDCSKPHGSSKKQARIIIKKKNAPAVGRWRWEGGAPAGEPTPDPCPRRAKFSHRAFRCAPWARLGRAPKAFGMGIRPPGRPMLCCAGCWAVPHGDVRWLCSGVRSFVVRGHLRLTRVLRSFVFRQTRLAYANVSIVTSSINLCFTYL